MDEKSLEYATPPVVAGLARRRRLLLLTIASIIARPAFFGRRKMSRFAIDAPDIITAAQRLGQATGLPFERRESDHYGHYCLIRLPADGGRIRVLENIDPVYRAELDPPEEQFFEPDFPADQVLIEIDVVDAAQFARWDRVIRDIFPNGVRTGRPAAG